MNENSWLEFTEEQKQTLISSMIIDASKSLTEGNPVLAILVPEGCKDDVDALWNGEMNQIVKDQSILELDHPHHNFYFPQIQENPQVLVPTLYKRTHQEESLLREYFDKVLKMSQVDPGTLLPITLTTESLRAFYLTAEVLMPALAKVKEPKSNLLIPGKF